MDNSQKNSQSFTTLSDFVAQQFAQSFFDGVAERITLATDFLYLIDDEINEAKNKKVKQDDDPRAFDINVIPFLSPENITMNFNEEERVFAINVQKPELDGKQKYTNYLYGCPEYFVYKPMIGSAHESSNEEVTKIFSKHYKKFSAHTLATLLFYIVFCTHPFMGREYYQNVSSSQDYDKKFFSQKHSYIFDLNGENRFVNGFRPHGKAWNLHNCQNDAQKEFWQKLMGGEFATVSQVRENWDNVFRYEYTVAQTDCGERVSAMVFSKDFVWLLSQLGIATNKLLCYGCNKSCPKPTCSEPKKCITELCTLDVQVTIVKKTFDAETSQYTTETKQSEIWLYPRKKLLERDFHWDSPSGAVYFDVLLHKNGKVLALRNLRSKTIVAKQGGKCYTYEKGKAIPLMPGAEIEVSDSCTLVVPNPNPQIEPIVEQTPTVVQQVEVDNDSIALLDGTILTVDKNVAPQVVGDSYTVVQVVQQDTNKRYCAKLFHDYVDQNQRDNALWILENIDKNLPLKLNEASLLYPVGIIQPYTGYCSGMGGYVYECPPSQAVTLAQYVTNHVFNLEITKKAKIALQACVAIKQLQEKGLCYGTFNENNILIDVAEGNVYFVNSEYVTKAPNTKLNVNVGYFAPEWSIQRQATFASDSYQLAIVLFKVLFGAHPFDRVKDCKIIIPNGAQRNEFYINKPIFLMTNLVQEMPKQIVDTCKTVPQTIGNMFAKMFNTKLIEQIVSGDKRVLQNISNIRPNVKQMQYLFAQWLRN